MNEENIHIEFEGQSNRAVAYDNDKEIGVCEFHVDSLYWSIDHTYVDPNYGGRGIAKKLVLSIVTQARAKGVKLIPLCSYAAKVLSASEYADLLA